MSFETLDEIEENEKLILFSKLSILITSILLTPFWGGFLYCANLRFSGQKDKINRTFITITMSYLMVLLPLMGFEMNDYYSSLIIHYFSRLIASLFIVLVLWKKQFEEIEYESIFPWKRIITIIIIQFGIIMYTTWLHSGHFTNLNLPINYYYIDFSLITILAFIFYFSFGDFIYRLIKRK